MTPAISSVAFSTTDGAESQDLLQTFRTQAGLLAGPVGMTVMRMRFHVTGSQILNANVNQGQFVLGVRVMDVTEAAAAETAAVPYSPVTDPHADWMCHEVFGPKSAGLAVASYIVDHHVDVRSMRKMDELGQTLVAVLAGVPPTGGTAATVTIQVCSSVLLALP